MQNVSKEGKWVVMNSVRGGGGYEQAARCVNMLGENVPGWGDSKYHVSEVGAWPCSGIDKEAMNLG